MQIEELIFKVILPIAEFLLMAIPIVIGIVNSNKKKIAAIKEKQQATTEKEFAEAQTKLLEAEKDIQRQKTILIEETEALYQQVGDTMKQAGLNVAKLKKDTVMSKLQNYALTKNYPFDYDYYSNEVENDIDHTKKVNAK